MVFGEMAICIWLGAILVNFLSMKLPQLDYENLCIDYALNLNSSCLSQNVFLRITHILKSRVQLLTLKT